MPGLNAPHLRAQLARLARLIGFVVTIAPIATALFPDWFLRYPVLGAGVGLLEVIWREIKRVAPVETASLVPSQTKPPAEPGPHA